MAFNHRESKSC